MNKASGLDGVKLKRENKRMENMHEDRQIRKQKEGDEQFSQLFVQIPDQTPLSADVNSSH